MRVQDKYFHTGCFKCKACGSSLAQGGFFSKDGAYYCTADYQRNFGTKCAACGDYVEGEVCVLIFSANLFISVFNMGVIIFQVVTALGKTYHQKCFTCARCRQPFPSGEKVTYTGKEVLCQKCVQIPVRDTTPKTSPATSPLPNGKFWYLNQLCHYFPCLVNTLPISCEKAQKLISIRVQQMNVN